MNELFAVLTKLIPLVGLVSLRIAVVMAVLPAPFGDVAPARTRAVLSVVLAYVLCLPQLSHLPALDLSGAGILVSGIGELLVGAVIGLTVRVTLSAIEIAGTLAGTAMGLNFAGQIDPLFGSESVPTSTMYAMLGTLVFLSFQGHHVVIQALAASLTIAPCGAALHAISPDAMFRIGVKMLAQGLRIASPVIATMFSLQLGAAFVARSAPRVQVFALTFGVTVSAGLWVIYTSAPSLVRVIASEVNKLPELLAAALLGGVP